MHLLGEILKWGSAVLLILVFLFFGSAMIWGVIDAINKREGEGER